jgi:hypothetical protein
MKFILHNVVLMWLVNYVTAFSVVPKTVNFIPSQHSTIRLRMEQQRSTSSTYLNTLEKQTNEMNDQKPDEILSSTATTSLISPNVITTDMRTEDAMMKDDKVVAVVEETTTDKTKQMLQQVKDAGIAGVISYAAWEIGFWALSVPVVLVGYYQFTGHWPDLSNGDDVAKLSAEAFAFVNFARFAVPLRIGLALGTTPWIQTNIVDRFMKKDEDSDTKKD